MNLKITLEFPNEAAAIDALAKLGGLGKYASSVTTGGAAPQAPAVAGDATGRRGRADKGQKRAPYGPRHQEAPGAPAQQPGSTQASTAEKAPATDPRNGDGQTQVPADQAPTATSTSGAASAAAGAPVASIEPAAPAPAAAQAQKAQSAEPPVSAAAAPTQADAQAAVERLYEHVNAKTGADKALETVRSVMSRFGAQRLRDMKAESYADFIKHADGVIAGATV